MRSSGGKILPKDVERGVPDHWNPPFSIFSTSTTPIEADSSADSWLVDVVRPLWIAIGIERSVIRRHDEAANPEKSTTKLLCDGTLFPILVVQMLLKLAFERIPLMIPERGGQPL
ncbi:MAG TPA: hypothetical protein VMJ30_10410 [Gemmatimonadales bacterium]|nr:hypothetical protein [Gemmatimonadales bacterium]